MLVLTRRRGERIKIGDNTWVTILEITSNRVKVGIEAPKQERVLRGELVPVTKTPAAA